TKTDGEGTSTYAYDGNGNMTSASYPASQWYQNGLVEEFNYDGENRPASKSTPDNGVIYIYDDAGRLSQANNGMSYLDCTRDANGNITSKQLSFWQGDTEKEFTYAYSPAGRMQSGSDEHGTTTYDYDAAGRLDSKSYPNGVDTSYGYDSSGALSALQMDNPSGTLKSYSVARDSCARVTGLTEDGSLNTTYSYDAASRLTGESNPFTGNASYAYDGCGNRTSKTTDIGTITCTYDPADRLTEDSAGNTYTYNSRGDLIQKSDGTHTLDITRDGKGRAEFIMKLDGITPTAAYLFQYDAQDRVYLSMEYDPANPQPTPLIHSYDMDTDRELALFDYDLNIDSVFFSGADGLISATTPQGTSYLSYNPHSDLSLVTDQSATPLEQLHYDAWGNTAEDTEQPYTYLGKHQRPDYDDPGLIRMGARLYDPETGRFTSKDRLKGVEALPISQNSYCYANDDPMTMRDLVGLMAAPGELSPLALCLEASIPESEFRNNPALATKSGSAVEYDDAAGNNSPDFRISASLTVKAFSKGLSALGRMSIRSLTVSYKLRRQPSYWREAPYVLATEAHEEVPIFPETVTYRNPQMWLFYGHGTWIQLERERGDRIDSSTVRWEFSLSASTRSFVDPWYFAGRLKIPGGELLVHGYLK
ncbi:MAG: hypothetical protein KKF41_12375, partial [Actinobacteria bacterium]|nr:hypothetical protein [Actinomycetota bacterium]MBU2688371.1 hypothetical protein [Actinomycetota bacterium]